MVFSFTIYIFKYFRNEGNIERIDEFFVGKTNTAVYLYNDLMISEIVLIATVFIVFNHAKNKKKTKERIVLATAE